MRRDKMKNMVNTVEAASVNGNTPRYLIPRGEANRNCAGSKCVKVRVFTHLTCDFEEISG